MHGGGGDADGHGDAHGAIRRETSDADGDGGEQRSGDGQDEEPGGDGALRVAERGEDLVDGFVEDVGVVEHRPEGGEGDVGQHGGADEEECGELVVHDCSVGIDRWCGSCGVVAGQRLGVATSACGGAAWR